jgi:hypothetical protein
MAVNFCRVLTSLNFAIITIRRMTSGELLK